MAHLDNMDQLESGRVREMAIELRHRLNRTPKWIKIDPITARHPDQLFYQQGAYERQICHELAAGLVAGKLQWSEAIGLAIHWKPALVKLYDYMKDKFVVLVWGTARDDCVHPLTSEFNDCLVRELAKVRVGYPNVVVIQGGSTTGSMGDLISMCEKHGLETINVLLGFTTNTKQSEAPSQYGKNSPPLYTFLLRLYFLSLLGRPLGRIVLPGGGGTLDEVLTELVERQMAKKTHTTQSHHQILCPIFWVSYLLQKGGFYYDGMRRQLAVCHNEGTLHTNEAGPQRHLVLGPQTIKHLNAAQGTQPSRSRRHGSKKGWRKTIDVFSPGDAAREVVEGMLHCYDSMTRTHPNGRGTH